MDLHDIRGGRLDVITEEAEELSRESTNMADGGLRAARGVSTFQRFSVDTDESLCFEPCEDGLPSPIGAERGLHGDVFEVAEAESDGVTIRKQLQGKVTEMENFASHLEEIFLTVEENFGRQEQHLEQHYNDVLQTLSQRCDDRAAGLEEEKKGKLEALYKQLLACGQAMDVSKELIETAQEVYRCPDERLFLKVSQALLPCASVSLEFNTPLANLPDVKTMMDSINIVPAPSAPVINPQTPNSATQTSLRVCWSLFSDDTVEYYELYYRPVLEDTPADSTLPSPPVIKQRECASCPEAALIRWESGNTDPVDSYTVELRETGTVAVPTCQCLIQLQAGRRYLICVRAVNIGGPSSRSEVISVSTTGTLFSLLEDTAHPCLCISEDGFTIFYGEEELPISAMALEDNNAFTRCVAVLGGLIPVRGRHYWEVEVDDGTEFRIGVASEDTERNSYLGANNTSWCMRHILTPARHKYEFLHNGWSPDLRITVNPVRIGVALDYERGTLSFFNVALEQHLHTFQCHFQNHVQPCFGLDNPGALTVHTGIEAPKYAFA
uniref:Fibronectin type III and SPRY domain containing 2 n=1 Tax=Gasterosteus aculeatus aculeatus TaxID=481459 RepID=A0AAQ4NVQ4_GASAC